MRKTFKSRLCALAMGVTFFAHSNAIQSYVLDPTTLLLDVNDKLVVNMPGMPNMPGCPIESIRQINSFSWNGGDFRVYFSTIPFPMATSDINMIPQEVKDQVNAFRNQLNGATQDVNKLSKKFMELTQSETEIDQIKNELKSIGKELKNLINANQEIKKNVKMLEREELLYNELFKKQIVKWKFVEEEQFSYVKFPIYKRENMNRYEYYEALKSLKKNRQNLLELIQNIIPTFPATGVHPQ